MKIKTVLITAAVLAAAAGGIGYGVYYSMQHSKSPVDVVPIANVNYAAYGWYDDSSTIYGSIISKDSQTVKLDADYELTKVYVQTGDTVKIGDPLLEYDMTLLELEAEMENLTMQSLQLNLESMQRALEKLQKTTPSASAAVADDSTLTASADVSADEAQPQAAETQQVAETQQAAETQQTAEPQSTTEQQQTTQNTESQSTEPQVSDPIAGDGSDTPLLDDTGTESTTTPSDPTGGTADGLIEDDSAGQELIDTPTQNDAETETLVDAQEIISNVNDFLTRVNQITEQDTSELILSDITEALRIYREELTTFETVTFQDVNKNNREKNVYTLKTEITDLVGSSTAGVIDQAYHRACVSQLAYYLNLINPEHIPVDEMDDAMIQAAAEYIRMAETAYYDLPENIGSDLDFEEQIKPYIDELGSLLVRLNVLEMVEETEPSSEPFTEFPNDFGDYGDGGYGGDDSGYTAEELKQAISDQQDEIDECQLQIKESQLRINQYQRKLDNKIIKSNMNGVVKSAGTATDSVLDEDFIVITGQAGMYVKGTVNELRRDSLKIGDQVSGTSYDTGLTFTASVTEVSTYPASSNSGYYGYGSDNSNASYYPFLAYVEDAEGLTEGDAELQIISNEMTTGIYLENYFIREESSGQKYVMIQGSDGLLKKQYVKTGKSLYNSATEIKEGVTGDDKIAFPYGKNVVEGAQTNEVDALESDTMYVG